MSSLWTPDGERPVARHPGSDTPPPSPFAGAEELSDAEMPSAEEIEAMRAELANAPVEVIVANHCYGLFELAAVYLSQQPPLLTQARLAIDALSCLVNGLAGRLGETEPTLKDGLAQLQMAFIQIDGVQRAGTSGLEGAGEDPPAETDAG